MKDKTVPLCVDLDGTLTSSDTLFESLLILLRQAPSSALSIPGWLLKGKAVFKHEIAARAMVNAKTLPFRRDLLEWLKAEHASGRQLVLATAADSKIADEIAQHLSLFDVIAASNGVENLSGEEKRRVLVERFGDKGFDYVGNDRCDEAVWSSSLKAIVVGAPAIVAAARRVAHVDRVFLPPSASIGVWFKAMRLHQWAKNILIFLPALLAHQIFEPAILATSLLAFFAFGLCASSVYLVNDLFDLVADRNHPRKRHRPFASGVLSAPNGLLVAAGLLVASALLAALVNWQFCVVLSVYYLITCSYSLRLKKSALVDVMTLAGLYTIRIIAGSAAAAVPLSFWLLAFSVFIFLSLAIVKRYTELQEAEGFEKVGEGGRGYSPHDLPLLLALGTAAGYCTVVVMALYVNSADSQVLYKHHKLLWLVCPLFLYWISRVWLLTTRGLMHDDPVVFALRDRISQLVFVLLGAIVFVAV